MDKFTTDSAQGMSIYSSLDDANRASMDATINVAKFHGFDTLQPNGGNMLCGMHSTARLVEVFKDGTWEYRDASEDEEKKESGFTSQTLDWFLESLPPAQT